MYTFRSPWQRRMSCSIIWFVSLIVKLREMVWTICAKSPLSLAALLILTSNVGIKKLFLRGSWLANWRFINWFIGALNSLWASVSCCSWWISSVVRAVSDRLGWLMCPSLSQSSLKLSPSMTGHVSQILVLHWNRWLSESPWKASDVNWFCTRCWHSASNGISKRP